MDEPRTFSLEALAALTDLPPRTVRYYIQTGLVARPHGTGKGAYYTQQHLEQLLQVKKWQQAGLSLERIGQILREGESNAPPPVPRARGAVEVWSHLVVADGIELMIEPGRAGLDPEQLRALFREVVKAFDALTGPRGEAE